LPNDWQTADRDQINKARRAAEDLFRPKQPTERAAPEKPSTEAAPSGEPAATTESSVPRKPRIIAIPAIVPMGDYIAEEPAPPPASAVSREPKATKAPAKKRVPKIPQAQYGRIQALASYGMTLAEVAAFYGVPESEIERIVAKG
jgi:hypothetical protein